MSWGHATRILAEETGKEMTPDQIESAVMWLIADYRKRHPASAVATDSEVLDMVVEEYKQRGQ
jgi:hypothetical protein